MALWNALVQAVKAGGAQTARHPGGGPTGFSFCSPHCAVCGAKRPLVIGNTPVPKGTRFTPECAAEGARAGDPFKRGAVVGEFQAAATDYCDRTSRHRTSNGKRAAPTGGVGVA
ncbi:hypothetical protein [Deinococcus hopiensis]|uniref:Uncharacterized protein n=1 Tax=Deinococcus hopiensis KR-140 TaxID=695939 RepID=A0A1W1VLX1_9DEIO|nr:hypothetical protein [Deinococcus hopiensis]SMB93944.1 hypothetical protein SAMN00790413_02177 [Deinococcus hopiensis KR-140]